MRGGVFGPALLVLLLVFPTPLRAQDVRSADCNDLGRRFERLISIYVDAGTAAIAETGDVGEALDKARQKALAGDLTATVTMTGIALANRSRAERYTVASVRQICTLAERTQLALHVATCTYFTALNPLGERAEKRRLVERGLKAFEALPENARGAPHFSQDMTFLATCLPPE
ncbi:MAG: hypothetical protein J0L51_11495 [Rhizobiales bacterium]|nr:hypothetical protein [Hyphomicrobiales bacterium]